MSLKNKVIKGGFYLTISNAFVHLISLVVSIYLARILSPKDFGLIALATTFIGVIDILINLGLGSAIIYNTKATNKQISTIYWLNYFWAVFVYLFIYFTVPLASSFFDTHLLTDVVRLAALSLVISPLFITHLKLRERDLQFSFISKITVVSALVSGLFSISAAYLGFGVYSLVIRILVGVIIKALFFLIFSDWKPIVTFRLYETLDMIFFSFKVKISQILLYLERNVDYLILGSFFTPNILGYYAFSYNIMYTPVKRISYVFGDILFPALSSIKNDKKSIASALLKSIQMIAIVTFSIMTLIAINADWIIKLFFTTKWIAAVPIIKILAFAGAFQSISQPCGVVFKSIGKPEILIYLSIIRTLLVSSSIVLGSMYGNFLIVIKLILVSKIISLFLVLYLIKRSINYEISKLFSSLIGPAFNMLLLISLNYFLIENTYLIGLLKFVVTSTISLIVIVFFHKELIFEIFDFIKNKK